MESTRLRPSIQPCELRAPLRLVLKPAQPRTSGSQHRGSEPPGRTAGPPLPSGVPPTCWAPLCPVPEPSRSLTPDSPPVPAGSPLGPRHQRPAPRPPAAPQQPRCRPAPRRPQRAARPQAAEPTRSLRAYRASRAALHPSAANTPPSAAPGFPPLPQGPRSRPGTPPPCPPPASCGRTPLCPVPQRPTAARRSPRWVGWGRGTHRAPPAAPQPPPAAPGPHLRHVSRRPAPPSPAYLLRASSAPRPTFLVFSHWQTARPLARPSAGTAFRLVNSAAAQGPARLKTRPNGAALRGALLLAGEVAGSAR